MNLAVDAIRVLAQPRAAGLVNAVLRRFVREHEASSCRARTRIRRGRRASRMAGCGAGRRVAGALPPHPGGQQRPPSHGAPPQYPPAAGRRISRRPGGRRTGGSALDWSVLPTGSVAVLLERPVAGRLAARLQGGLGLRAGRRRTACAAAARARSRECGCSTPAPLPAARPVICSKRGRPARGDRGGHRLPAVWGGSPRTWSGLASPRGWLRRTRAIPTPSGMVGLIERILVDAPCSGTGVIRRHPDIKLLRRAEDVTAFARTQLEMLRAAFRHAGSRGAAGVRDLLGPAGGE